MPSGATRVAGVIGDPVEHSLSPVMHNAAFAALGLDWIYVAFPVPARFGEAAVRAVPHLGIAGLSVTMPHKVAAARACDRLTDTASTLGVVNAVTPAVDGLLGDSTDGEGFLRALGDERVDPASARILVVGAGGAARSIVHALGTRRARCTVAARRADAARACAALAPGGEAVSLDALDEVIPAADVVVHATPLGMNGEEPPFSAELIESTQLVVDTVYGPGETPLVGRARARGAVALDGIGMLVHQGAIAFEQWTGRTAPVAVMRAAAQGAR